jgi:hypothetical protein
MAGQGSLVQSISVGDLLHFLDIIERPPFHPADYRKRLAKVSLHVPRIMRQRHEHFTWPLMLRQHVILDDRQITACSSRRRSKFRFDVWVEGLRYLRACRGEPQDCSCRWAAAIAVPCVTRSRNPLVVYVCHCTDCQSLGAAFAIGVVVQAAAFTLTGSPRLALRVLGSGTIETAEFAPNVAF